jgi:opacity protein-like surface antigen
MSEHQIHQTMKHQIHRTSSIVLRSAIVAGATLAGAFGGVTEAVIAPVPAPESGWQVRTALYGWATMLDGDVTLRGIDAPVDVGFDEILDNLDYAVMGVVEVGHGKWSFLSDMFLAQLSADGSIRDLEYDTQLDQFIGNFAINRNIISAPCTRLDLYAGARVNSMDLDLDIKRTGLFSTRTFSDSDSKTWVDPVIGARFQQELSEKFFIRAVADIGGFGVSSDLTWQALAALGYHIGDSSSVAIGYRGLGTDYEDGDFGYDVISHGVIIGFEYKF